MHQPDWLQDVSTPEQDTKEHNDEVPATVSIETNITSHPEIPSSESISTEVTGEVPDWLQ